MSELSVQRTRSGIVESVHSVSAAVVDRNGDLVAFCGDPRLVTFVRSAAKPFQALPLVTDGVAERFALTPPELALACASHNSEITQVRLVSAFLERIGCSESDLACGPHRPLGFSFSRPPIAPEELSEPSPLASNCSGKHAGMLALARHRGWDLAGYERAGHPVQMRMKQELARWTGLDESAVAEGVDGCSVVAFAVPLFNMALAMARLITGRGEPERAVVSAMTAHPELVAGQRRLCTELMQAYPGRVLAKVGAAGVYAAAIAESGLGVCLKIEDGDTEAAMVALLAILDGLDVVPAPSTLLPRFAEIPNFNTCQERVGVVRAAGRLTTL